MTKTIRWQSVLGAAAALALTVTVAAAQTPAKTDKPAGSGVEHAVAGTVTKVDAAAKTVAIKTAQGTTEVLKFGAAGAAKTAAATREGVDVVAHYSVKGGEKTLTGIEEVGKGSLKGLEGTVTKIDRGARTVAIKTADGAEQVYHLTAKGGVETAEGFKTGLDAAGEGIKVGSKVTVDFTESAGRKVGHVFKSIVGK